MKLDEERKSHRKEKKFYNMNFSQTLILPSNMSDGKITKYYWKNTENKLNFIPPHHDTLTSLLDLP